MKKFAPIILLLGGLLTGRAADPVADGAVQDDQPLSILLLVDTSLGMAPLRDHVAQRVYELITSGFQGQLADGDQILVWPFNETVHRNAFAPKTWTEARKELVAEEVFLFLNRLVFERTQRLDQALVALYDLSSSNRYTTGLIFSNGDTQIVGSPFDLYINAIYRGHRRTARRDQAPVITVLAFENSAIDQWAVFTHNGVIGLPTLPRPDVVPDVQVEPKVTAPEPDPQPNLSETEEPPQPAPEIADAPVAPSLTTNSPPQTQIESTNEAPEIVAQRDQNQSVQSVAPPVEDTPVPPTQPEIEEPNISIQDSSPPPPLPEKETVSIKLKPAEPFTSPALMETNATPAVVSEDVTTPTNFPPPKPSPTQPLDAPAFQPAAAPSAAPAANQENTGRNRLVIFLIIAVIAVAGLVLLLALGRKPSKPSLISQYYDRPR